jgi:hypothetical protein
VLPQQPGLYNYEGFCSVQPSVETLQHGFCHITVATICPGPSLPWLNRHDKVLWGHSHCAKFACVILCWAIMCHCGSKINASCIMQCCVRCTVTVNRRNTDFHGRTYMQFACAHSLPAWQCMQIGNQPPWLVLHQWCTGCMLSRSHTNCFAPETTPNFDPDSGLRHLLGNTRVHKRFQAAKAIFVFWCTNARS